MPISVLLLPVDIGDTQRTCQILKDELHIFRFASKITIPNLILLAGNILQGYNKTDQFLPGIPDGSMTSSL